MRTDPPSLPYAHEKFSNAVRALATGAGPINDRLFYAWVSFMTLSERDFPPGDMRADFAKLWGALTRERAKGDEGNVKATLSIMAPMRRWNLPS